MNKKLVLRGANHCKTSGLGASHTIRQKIVKLAVLGFSDHIVLSADTDKKTSKNYLIHVVNGVNNIVSHMRVYPSEQNKPLSQQPHQLNIYSQLKLRFREMSKITSFRPPYLNDDPRVIENHDFPQCTSSCQQYNIRILTDG